MISSIKSLAMPRKASGRLKILSAIGQGLTALTLLGGAVSGWTKAYHEGEQVGMMAKELGVQVSRAWRLKENCKDGQE